MRRPPLRREPKPARPAEDTQPSAQEQAEGIEAGAIESGAIEAGHVDADEATTQCAVCLEMVPAWSERCPECDEDPSGVPQSVGPATSRPASLADHAPDASWLRQHWRPLLTMTAMTALLGTGIALRSLAPARPEPVKPAAAAPIVAATCDSPCWSGEACQEGRCVWQQPNDVSHIAAKPSLAGPFSVPHNMRDVMPLDGERLAVSYMNGVRIVNARTGGTLSLVSEAPQAQKMARVKDVLYVGSPRNIYVIDVNTTRVLKTIETGHPVESFSIGADGNRVLATMPAPRAAAVIATDYHAIVNRFFFGDDPVGPIALDDTGTRALTTNGRVPLPGLSPPRSAIRFGAVYAFDPSRLASNQDRVRTGMTGNPVDVLMAPDAKTSYAVLRQQNAVVAMTRRPSGAVRQEKRLETCRQPEAIDLVRRGRRAIVRCNLGHAVEIFSLERGELLKHIPLNARVADMAVTPDGRQAILVMPRAGKGAIGVLDLDDYELRLTELDAEPHRVRMTPDGRTAVVISDRNKSVWVLR